MRVIKFRGKRLDNGEWLYGSLSIIYGDRAAILPPNVVNHYRVFPATIGQFTGLTDKNGKEIFEGDVIKWSDFNSEVKFKDGCFIIPNVTELYRLMINWEVEVIGNILDSPELLKKRIK